MQEYWRRLFECPFYETNNKRMLKCEAGKLYFDTADGICQMMETCVSGYRECPIYLAKQTDYDVKERERVEKNKSKRCVR